MTMWDHLPAERLAQRKPTVPTRPLDDDMKIIGEPISTIVCLGGMCGPEGSSSRESFYRRRKATLDVLIQEEDVEFYAHDKDACIELGKMLGEVLHRRLEYETQPRRKQ
jgi:hypothetical protein